MVLVHWTKTSIPLDWEMRLTLVVEKETVGPAYVSVISCIVA